MSKLQFPLKYKQATLVPADCLPDNIKITNMASFYRGSSKKILMPVVDTSNVTDMSYMFNYCSALTSVPLFDTSNVTNMSNLFNYCSVLTTIPQLDTSNVTNMSNMFAGCSALTAVPLLDCGKVTNIQLFGYGDIASVKHLGGFKDLGKVSSVSGTSSTYLMTRVPNLTKESVLNVLNNLYDRKTAGLSVLTLKLHANHLAMLSDEEKAIATNKGWTLS